MQAFCAFESHLDFGWGFLVRPQKSCEIFLVPMSSSSKAVAKLKPAAMPQDERAAEARESFDMLVEYTSAWLLPGLLSLVAQASNFV